MNFRQLRAYDDYISANLRLQQLESEGIRCYLQDEHTVTIDPILSNAVGGIKLMIYEEQFERAEKIILQIEEEYRKSARCPRCGAHGLELVTNTRKASNWLSALLTWMLGNYALSVSQVYRCFQCGYEMEDLPSAEQSETSPK